MPIVINGSGSITGLSVGGLPDGSVDADTLASNAVTAGKLASGVGGKVLQVVSTSDANSILQGQITVPTTNGSLTNVVEFPNISISITPSATTSKILLSINVFGEGNDHDEAYIFNIKRAISGVPLNRKPAHRWPSTGARSTSWLRTTTWASPITRA